MEYLVNIVPTQSETKKSTFNNIILEDFTVANE